MTEEVSTQVHAKKTQRFFKNLKYAPLKLRRFTRHHPWASVAVVVAVGVIITGAIVLANRGDMKVANTASNNPVTAEYKKQLPELKSAAQKSPNSAVAHKNYAVALYAVGDLKGARDEYKKATKLKANDSTAWNNLGNAYRDLGDNDAAINAYQKALDLDQSAVNTYVNLANLQLYTLNKPNDAIATYKKAVSHLPDNEQLQLLLALAYEQAGNTVSAKQTLQNILAKNPDNSAAKANLARISQ